MISGPRVVSARASPFTISPRGEPVEDIDGLLRNIGEHRVGAIEGDHRGTGEEQSLFHKDAVASGYNPGEQHRGEPQQQPNPDHAQCAPGGRQVVVKRIVADQRRRAVARPRGPAPRTTQAAACPTPNPAGPRPTPPTETGLS
jgi:hypothetical protein